MDRSSESGRFGLPISAKLTAWYGLTFALLLGIFGIYSYERFHQGLHARFDRHLRKQTRRMERFIDRSGPRPGFAHSDTLQAATLTFGREHQIYGLITGPRGRIYDRTPNLQGKAPPVQPPANATDTIRSIQWKGEDYRVRWQPLSEPASGAGPAWLAVLCSEEALHGTVGEFRRALLGGLGLTLVLALLGGYLLARRSLRPVDRLSSAARSVQLGREEGRSRLPVPSGTEDELTRLAATFNDLLARLEEAIERERQLSADAAHELLTPLTTLQTKVDVALQRDREASAYRSALTSAREEITHMIRAVRGLLSLHEVEQGGPPPREPVPLTELAARRIEYWQDQAKAEGIALTCRAEDRVQVAGHPDRLVEAIDNLLENALKYTPEGGSVELLVTGEDGEALLQVRDTGPGFEDGEGGQLFERFYRGTGAAQETRGSGLGLTAVRAIVKAHGGEVRAQSDGPGQGTTFVLRLPAQPTSTRSAQVGE